MISICFTWFPIGGLGEPNVYQNLGDLTDNGDFTWRVSDCEELVGGRDDKELNANCFLEDHLQFRLLVQCNRYEASPHVLCEIT